MTASGRVEIVDQGRSGTVTYVEGEHRLSFWWEFGLEPTLAFVDGGPKRADFDREHPWAAGRQPEIFDRIAEEVVRQRAPGHDFDVDLDAGSIRILRRGGRAARAAASLDLEALAMREPGALLPDFLRSVLSGMPTAPPLAGDIASEEPSDAMLEEGMRDHLSIGRRLTSAARLHARGQLDDASLGHIVRRQLRELSSPTDGLDLALSLAARHDSPLMRQALLYASYNRTPCAPACARLLLRLHRGTSEPDVATDEPLIARLDPHNSSGTRQGAFEELCARVGMTFEPDAD